MKCNFSYDHYSYILDKAKKRFRFVKFQEFDESNLKKQLILRHDVDFCVESAYTTAKIEYEKGIKSTFFLLINSPFYNILNDHEHELIELILEMGHDLGLHYFIPKKITAINKQKKYIMKQSKILETLFDTKIKAISPHLVRRSKSLPNLEGFLNVHEPKFFTNIGYISDSLQKWRGACICKEIENYDNIQLLIHPIWWNTQSENWQERIKKVSRRKIERLNRAYEDTINLYKDGLKRRKQLDDIFNKEIGPLFK